MHDEAGPCDSSREGIEGSVPLPPPLAPAAVSTCACPTHSSKCFANSFPPRPSGAPCAVIGARRSRAPRYPDVRGRGSARAMPKAARCTCHGAARLNGVKGGVSTNIRQVAGRLLRRAAAQKQTDLRRPALTAPQADLRIPSSGIELWVDLIAIHPLTWRALSSSRLLDNARNVHQTLLEPSFLESNAIL
jgi:hypothetical protein